MSLLLGSINPKVRVLIAAILTIASLLILLWPSDVSRHVSFFSSFFSFELRPFDFIEAIGHIFLFAFVTLVWQWALVKYVALERAIFVTIVIVSTLALGTEIGQYFVNRSSLLFDLLANILGISFAIVAYRIYYQTNS